MPTFGPDAASCEVLTFREGLLSPLAHDLVLRATGFEISVDPESRAVSGRFDPRSLRVVTAMRDGRPLPQALSDANKKEIEATIEREVLNPRLFPEIRFASKAAVLRGRGYDVRGMLTLAGTTREVAFPVRREGEKLTAELWLHQPDFGIRPYTAMLGTLRVKGDVLVRVSVPAQGL